MVSDRESDAEQHGRGVYKQWREEQERKLLTAYHEGMQDGVRLMAAKPPMLSALEVGLVIGSIYRAISVSGDEVINNLLRGIARKINEESRERFKREELQGRRFPL